MKHGPGKVIEKAPITTLSAAESLTAFVLTFLTAHHVLGDVDISTTTQTVAPFVALVLPALFGVAKWRLVTPAGRARRRGDVARRDYRDTSVPRGMSAGRRHSHALS